MNFRPGEHHLTIWLFGKGIPRSFGPVKKKMSHLIAFIFTPTKRVEKRHKSQFPATYILLARPHKHKTERECAVKPQTSRPINVLPRKIFWRPPKITSIVYFNQSWKYEWSNIIKKSCESLVIRLDKNPNSAGWVNNILVPLLEEGKIGKFSQKCIIYNKVNIKTILHKLKSTKLLLSGVFKIKRQQTSAALQVYSNKIAKCDLNRQPSQDLIWSSVSSDSKRCLLHALL